MILFYAGFIAFILVLLALDLGVFHKESHEIRPGEAMAWFAFWAALGLAFTGFVYLAYEGHWRGIGSGGDLMSVSAANPEGLNDGKAAALKYVAGYLIEKSLSMDNIFSIAMLFGMMEVPKKYRHRVLFWGILGALVMRGVMIAVGVELLSKFSWILYVFGGILILSALKMLFLKSSGGRSGYALLDLARRFLPVTRHFHGQSFWVRAGPGTFRVTPLFLALLAVELADLIFALDSIPAVFAITTDPFLVFTGNVFAMLGLRSLYFALEGMIGAFHHLKTALALVMLLVGLKMTAHEWLEAALGENFNVWMLALLIAILIGGVVASLLFPDKRKAL